MKRCAALASIAHRQFSNPAFLVTLKINHYHIKIMKSLTNCDAEILSRKLDSIKEISLGCMYKQIEACSNSSINLLFIFLSILYSLTFWMDEMLIYAKVLLLAKVSRKKS